MNVKEPNKLTLKCIVESLPANSGFDNRASKMAIEQKKRLRELASNFRIFGECLQNEQALIDSANNIAELCELAANYAVNEGSKMFQDRIIVKDMDNLNRRANEFKKIMMELHSKYQQAAIADEDIGHIMGRYYELSDKSGNNFTSNKGGSSLSKKVIENNENEEDAGFKRICGWCKKPLGSPEEIKSTANSSRITHGICPACYKNMEDEIKNLKPQKNQVSSHDA